MNTQAKTKYVDNFFGGSFVSLHGGNLRLPVGFPRFVLLIAGGK